MFQSIKLFKLPKLLSVPTLFKSNTGYSDTIIGNSRKRETIKRKKIHLYKINNYVPRSAQNLK